MDRSKDVPDVIVSGSYDHSVKLWDTRTKIVTSTYEHKYPVEDVIFLNPQEIASCSGSEVYIWDTRTGNIIRTASNHHKTVTHLTLHTIPNLQQVILASSLDQHISLFAKESIDTIHTTSYTAPVLTCAVSENYMVLGLSDGNFIVRGRDIEGHQEVDNTTSNAQKQIMWLLSKFRYSEVLDVLVEMNDPITIISFFDEMILRNTLEQALHRRNDATLAPILTFIHKNIIKDQYTGILIIVLNKILDIYGGVVGLSSIFDSQIDLIKSTISNEIMIEKELMKVTGILQMITENAKKRSLQNNKSLEQLN